MQITGRHDKGPVVGIITTGKNATVHTNGNISHLYKDLISYGRKKGIFIYYFYPRNINWSQRKIKGYSHDGNKWRSGNYPFPDVVYNRILYRTAEESTEVKSILRKFEQDKDIYLFNSRFLDKWEVHKAISSNKETAHLVPDTELLTRENLIIMLYRHKEVLLKPRRSSKGHGIIKIKMSGDSLYLFSRAEWNNPRWIKAATINSLIRQLDVLRIFNQNYLVQECIDLTRYNGRIFDLRSQFQKNCEGRWVMTGVGVRIAGKNRFVTHIPNGGTLAAYNDIIPSLAEIDSHNSQSFDKQLKNICLFIPKLLEEKLQINLAILTMDIGIDQTGRMLILEVNSKPARFDEPHIRQRHLNNLIDYFLFLTGKKYKRNDN
ncbi:MAG TPA: YheC/YheD family protein [Syntrophomonadaceae bacterium]|nr:YheC/YheD family protein [Syntrophomonadaceae bacterium]HNX28692.1 YheC/YheD family protein [Syntrophomonadaceae bacterium]HPR93510.1 YheC/YheD family protein [Syntrophomonadaceae bacterium]